MGDAVAEARDLLKRTRYYEVIDLLRPWVAARPHDDGAWELIAAAHFELREWQEAAEAASRVTELRPDSARAWYNRGVALRKAGSTHAARAAQQRALRLSPQHPGALRELAKLGPHVFPKPSDATLARRVPVAPPRYCPDCGAVLADEGAECNACAVRRRLAGRVDERWPAPSAPQAPLPVWPDGASAPSPSGHSPSPTEAVDRYQPPVVPYRCLSCPWCASPNLATVHKPGESGGANTYAIFIILLAVITCGLALILLFLYPAFLRPSYTYYHCNACGSEFDDRTLRRLAPASPADRRQTLIVVAVVAGVVLLYAIAVVVVTGMAR